jgi:di/tricarboxylate transporter
VAGVDHVTTGPSKPLILLAAIYLITLLLTEILSNNAVAALMIPIVLGIAQEAGLQAQPFIIAVTVAASAAFATPIGYQTNTYVYGIGGYKFADFVKIGVPLNVLCFTVAMIVIPRVWAF